MSTRADGHDPDAQASPFDKVAFFGLLSFGQNPTAQHEAVASLYGYFGTTIIILLFVRTLPPYSGNRWLA